MNMKWADLVKELMREHGFSQRSLCAAVGINRSTLRRFLHGETGLTIHWLDKMLDLFGYELDFMKVGTLTHDILVAGHKPQPKPACSRPIIRTISIRRKTA